MNKHTERKARLRREWWLTTAVALVMLALLVLGDLARPMGNVLYDHLMRLQGFRATQNIVIIAVDDRSLQELGGWPLQRSQYTELLKRLDDNCCRPKVIGLDLLFLDPSSDDLALAEAIKQHKAVLPLAFKVQEDSPSSLQAIDPVAPLNEAATLGHINLSFDTDGVIRGIHTHEQGWSHFALALHAKGENKNATSAQSGHYRRFRMVDPRVGFPMISLADALENNISRTLLKDKYVLIGVTAPSLGDRYHCRATTSKVLRLATLCASFSACLANMGSTPLAMSLLRVSRFSRASARLTSGYCPKDAVFSLPRCL